MAESRAPQAPDLVRDPQASLLLWRLPTAALIATFLAGNMALNTGVWTAALTQMGLACLLNASGCGRLHCYFTGPFFLLGAVASLLQGRGSVRIGWGRLGIILLVGGVSLAYLPEMLWGKYAGRAGACGQAGADTGACCRSADKEGL